MRMGTSNIQHPTPNIQLSWRGKSVERGHQTSMFGVQCFPNF
jgi:hypothetical protein